MGLLTKEERVGTITTVQRFLNRDIVKEALGIDSSNLENVTFNRPIEDFRKLLGLFVTDLKDGERVNSRKNRDQVDAYGRILARTKGVSGKRVQPQSLKTAVASTTKPEGAKRRIKPKEPRKLAYLGYDIELGAALDEARSNSAKFKSLLRHAAARTVDALENAIADAFNDFTPQECINYFTAAGYGSAR